MKQLWMFLAVVAVALSGCNAGPWDAPPGRILDDEEDFKVSWFGCQIDPLTFQPLDPNCDLDQPSPPVIIPFSIGVTDEETTTPVNNIWVRVSSGFKDVYLLPQEVIEAVALPDTENWQDVAASGEVWAEFSGSFEGDYRPTFVETWTDNNGQVDFWIWVDKMPVDPVSGQAVETSVLIDIGVDSATLLLQPGAG